MNDLAVIHLTNGGFAVVDADLFPALSVFKWQRCSKGGAYRSEYVCGKSRTVALHRVVNNTPKGVHTDHRNGFRVDNTRRNLRNATKSLNAANSMPRKRNTGSQFGSNFKGVSRNPDCKSKPWVARIGCRETQKHLGSYATELEAAAAYNTAAIERFGEFAKLNPLPTEVSLGL